MSRRRDPGRDDPRVIPFRRPPPPPRPRAEWRKPAVLFLGLFTAALVVAALLSGGMPATRDLIVCLVFALAVTAAGRAGPRRGGS